MLMNKLSRILKICDLFIIPLIYVLNTTIENVDHHEIQLNRYH